MIHNNTSSLANSFARYGYGESELIGLGSDIDNALTSYLQQSIPNAAVAGSDVGGKRISPHCSVLVNDNFHTNMYNKNGNPLPQGTAQVRTFIEHDCGLYVGDTYRATRELTLTFGLRWENFRPPYEANGYQVDPTVGLNQYFAERNFLQSQGVPQNAMPNATLSWALNGPVNGKPTWWSPDNHNFRAAHRHCLRAGGSWGMAGQAVRFAWSLPCGRRYRIRPVRERPDHSIRSIRLHRARLRRQFSGFVRLHDFPRYNGAPPVLRDAGSETFPYAPPQIAAIIGDFLGISPDLKTPYSYLINASFERELPGKMVFSAGYAGRLSHRLLMEGDVYTPLEYFKDPKSGITWAQNADTVRGVYDSLLAKDGNPTAVIADVTAHPNLVPNASVRRGYLARPCGRRYSERQRVGELL